ncbi:hypothetical protein D9M72_414470 [compost metagenome]
MSRQQVDEEVGVFGLQRVLDGARGLALRQPPVGGAPVQARHLGAGHLPQLRAQKIAKQRVVAKPLPVGVLRHQEQVGALDVRQHLAAVVAAQHVVAQRRTQFLQHAAAQQKVAQRLGLAREHVFGEVVGDGRVRAVEGVDEVLRIAAVAQRQRHQPQRRRPSFGAVLQAVDVVVAQGQSVLVPQERSRFLRAETQRGRLDLVQPAVRAQPPQAQLRHRARADHELAALGQVLDELAHQAEDDRAFDALEVVHEQREMARETGQVAGQREHRTVGVAGQVGAALLDGGGDGRIDRAEGLDHVGEKAAQVVVRAIERDPARRGAALLQLCKVLQHHGGLAEARRPMHEHERGLVGRVQVLEQLGTRHRARRTQARVQLRGGDGPRGRRGRGLQDRFVSV